MLATNLAGSRRVVAGAARDHFLGCVAVDGRGERFRAGGKVVKNVTGYDLPKLLAGSWGTLAVLADVTIRVMPAAETERTLLVEAEDTAAAVAAMTAALGSPHDVSAAAFDPSRGVCLRLEGFAASVDARAAALRELVRADAAPRDRRVARALGCDRRRRDRSPTGRSSGASRLRRARLRKCSPSSSPRLGCSTGAAV